MDNNLSQEEIELLMEGSLSESRQKEILSNETEENTSETVNLQEQTETEEQVDIIKEDSVKNKKEKKIKQKKTKNGKIAKTSIISTIKDKLKKNKTVNTSDPTNSENELQITSKENAKLLRNINDVSTNTLFKIIIVLLILVILMGVGLIFLQFYKNSLVSGNVKKTSVSVPAYKQNTTNFIYIGDTKEFKGSTLKLVKILIDPIATLFYFDTPLDFMNYEANLKDKDGKSYSMDISFAETNNTEEVENSIIRFEPLDKGVKEFTLSISDTYSGESVQYLISLKSKPEPLSAKYIPTPIKTNNSSSDIQIILEEATFSSAGSIIEYRLHWKDNLETIKSGWKGLPPSELITIEEFSSSLPMTKSYPSIYPFPDNNTILGRMDFGAVKNLASTINISFKNLFKLHQLEQNIDITDLPYGEELENQKSIISGNYKIILERFADFNDKCILVYHGEDISNSSNSNRVEIKLDAQLSIGDGSGLEILLDGECQSKQEGAQIVFDTSKVQELIGKLQNRKYQLNIKNIGIRFPDQTINLNLNELNDEEIQIDKKEVKDFIIESFKKRLSVKSGEMNASELTNYFEPAILKEDTIVRDYLQDEKLLQPAEYSSQVLTMGKDDNNVYYAIVQDAWKGNQESKEIHFYRTHKVIVKKINGNWLITQDTIIK